MWKPINKRTPKKLVIWVGGLYAGKWCYKIMSEIEDEAPKWATHWHYCPTPEPPEQI